jgi:methionyl-tRNA formyltransferase
MHRGPIPTFYALLESPPKFGVTVHRLVARIDAGAILAQEAVSLPPNMSVIGAAYYLHHKGTALLERVLASNPFGEPQQKSDLLPYCPFPDKSGLRGARRRGVRLSRLGDLKFLLR